MHSDAGPFPYRPPEPLSMLQGVSQNPDLTIRWGAPLRQSDGKSHLGGEGYSQEDIKNGFRIDSLAPSPIGDRLKMSCAVVFSLLVPFSALSALLLVIASWLNLSWQAYQSDGVFGNWGLLVLVAGDLFLLAFLWAFGRRVLRTRNQAKSYFTVAEVDQPELHSFLKHIAGLLGAPQPSSVKLDAEVGLVLRPASLRAVLVGKGPEVVIGLPLLYGLSARQLSGVIAHAYAGYSREARLSGYPVLSAVDRWLFSQTGVGRHNRVSKGDFSSDTLSLVDRVFKPLDVLVQGSFYLVYRIVSAMTFDISRKVDMAGDMLSARIAGSTEFRSTQFRLRSLHYGQVNANQELANSWPEKKLAENFPALVVDHADTLQLSLRPRLIQEMEELVTPLTRSRIVDLGRIVNVEHTQEEGACYLLGAAISLLREPAEISKVVSLAYYRFIGIRHPDLYATQKTQTVQKAEREKARRHEVFMGLELSGRVVRVDDFEKYQSSAVESRLVDFRLLNQKLSRHEPEISDHAKALRGFEHRKNLLHTRKVVGECRRIEGNVLKALEVQWLALIKDQSDSKSRLVSYESCFSRKAAIAMSLALDSADIQSKLQMTRNEMHAHFVRLVDALNFIHRSFESILRLRSYTQVMGQLLVETGVDSRSNPALLEMSNRYQRYMMIELDVLIRVFSGVTYPLGELRFPGTSAADGEASLLTIGEVIRMEVPDLDSAGSCPEACHRVANAVCQYLDVFNEEIQQRLTGIISCVSECYSESAAMSK